MTWTNPMTKSKATIQRPPANESRPLPCAFTCKQKYPKRRKEERAMYEASDIVAIGAAHELIRGQKPFSMNPMDSDFEINRADKVEDIDEVDE